MVMIQINTPTTSEHVPQIWRELHDFLDLLSFKYKRYNQ